MNFFNKKLNNLITYVTQISFKEIKGKFKPVLTFILILILTFGFNRVFASIFPNKTDSFMVDYFSKECNLNEDNWIVPLGSKAKIDNFKISSEENIRGYIQFAKSIDFFDPISLDLNEIYPENLLFQISIKDIEKNEISLILNDGEVNEISISKLNSQYRESENIDKQSSQTNLSHRITKISFEREYFNINGADKIQFWAHVFYTTKEKPNSPERIASIVLVLPASEFKYQSSVKLLLAIKNDNLIDLGSHVLISDCRLASKTTN